DYYRMVAVFEPLQRPVNGRTELTLPIGTPAQVSAAREERDRQLATLARELEELKKTGKAGSQAKLEKAIQELHQKPLDLPQGYSLREPSANSPVSRLLFRGQAATPGPQVGPGVPAVVVKSQPLFPSPRPGEHTSRRRLTLARWVTSPENALT